MAINPYALYPTKMDAPSVAYPYGEPRDVVTNGDGTGTPYTELILKDMMGFFQALISHGTGGPTGTPDAANASQYHDNMRKQSGYPGLIVPYVLNHLPSSVGLRILLLDGSAVLINLYPELVGNTYVGDPLNPTADSFYKTSDASGLVRSTTGGYLKLPDMRGRFLRGLDVAATRDEDGAARIAGSFQTDGVSAHEHVLKDGSGTTLQDQQIHVDTTPTTMTVISDIGTGVAHAEFISSGNNTTADNRPFNMAVDYGVWY